MDYDGGSCKEYYKEQIIQMINSIEDEKLLAWFYHFIVDALKQWK